MGIEFQQTGSYSGPVLLFFWRLVGLVTKSCLTLCDLTDSLLGSSAHGISQARILEWVAISFSRDLCF